MQSTAAWEREDLDLVSGAPPAENTELTSAGGHITSLRELTFTLLRKVESIGEVHTPDIESGVDFYDEVSRFEIDFRAASCDFVDRFFALGEGDPRITRNTWPT
ncbi:MAG: hypothetical protein ACR2HX_20430 [Pyrinomonadaceae bacterium]